MAQTVSCCTARMPMAVLLAWRDEQHPLHSSSLQAATRHLPRDSRSYTIAHACMHACSQVVCVEAGQDLLVCVRRCYARVGATRRH